MTSAIVEKGSTNDCCSNNTNSRATNRRTQKTSILRGSIKKQCRASAALGGLEEIMK